jgi:transcription initiation factor TFIIA large subunit
MQPLPSQYGAPTHSPQAQQQQYVQPQQNYQHQQIPPQHIPQMPQVPQQMNMQQPMPPQHQQANVGVGGVQIKREPGLENQVQTPMYSQGPNMPAQMRAVQNLQAQFGARAQNSINAIQQAVGQGQQRSMSQNGQQGQQGQQQQAPGQQPQIGIPRPQMSQGQYQQAMAQQMAAAKQQIQQHAQQGQQQQGQQQQQQQGQGQNGVQNAQTDGGADDDEDRHAHWGVLKSIGPDGETSMGRVEIDGLLMRQFEAKAKAMEGGGLMVPLKQHNFSASSTSRQRKRTRSPTSSSPSTPSHVKTEISASKGKGPAQYDGLSDDDDEEEKIKPETDDDDAINSDLDDSDDDAKSDESGDEETPQVMLCMYDKVQRVKNKWYVLLFPCDPARGWLCSSCCCTLFGRA